MQSSFVVVVDAKFRIQQEDGWHDGRGEDYCQHCSHVSVLSRRSLHNPQAIFRLSLLMIPHWIRCLGCSTVYSTGGRNT
jgi:hypothetical protein